VEGVRVQRLESEHDRCGAVSEPAQVEVGLDAEEAALLAEALRLTDETDPARVLKLALRELVERQRFRRWVDRHEPR
jgi:hypothetical protein